MSNSPNWLAAEFVIPTTYSLREPGSSLTFAKACPVPGPGTIKLALISVAVELYGKERTQQDIFPIIKNLEILIRPPASVGITAQFLRAFKNKPRYSGEVQASISYREHVHATGKLVIYLKCVEGDSKIIASLIHLIGYWGQGNSLTYCTAIREVQPVQRECIRRLDSTTPGGIKEYMLRYLSDVDKLTTWDSLMVGEGIFLSLYVLPLVAIQRKKNGRVLKYEQFPE